MHTKEIIILGRTRSSAAVKRSIAGFNANGKGIVIIGWDTDVIEQLKRDGLEAHSVEEYNDAYADVYGPFDRGKALLEALHEECRMLWPELARYLKMYLPYLAMFHVSRVFTNILIAEYILRKEEPKGVRLVGYDTNDYLQNAVALVAAQKGIPLKKHGSLQGFLARFSEAILSPTARICARIAMNLCAIARSFLNNADSIGKERKQVLFVSTSGPQLDAFIPLAETCGFPAAFLCTSDRSRIRKEVTEKFKVLRLGEFASLTATLRLPIAYVQLARNWERMKRELKSRSYFVFNGMNISEYLFAMIEREMPRRLDVQLDGQGKNERMLSRLRPSMILSTEDPSPKIRSVFMLARDAGIKTGVMQYGVLRPHSPSELFSVADYFFVSGDTVKDYFVQTGIAKDAIFVVGMPRLAEMSAKGAMRRDESCAKYGIDPQKKIVLLTSHAAIREEPRFENPSTYREYHDWLRDIYRVMNGFTDVEFVVRPHYYFYMSDADPAAIHRTVREATGSNAKIITVPDSTSELIDMSAIIITWISTTAIEAILKGKNVVSYNTTMRDWKVPFVESGAVATAGDAISLKLALERLLDPDGGLCQALEQRKCEFIEKYFCGKSEPASARMAKQLKEMMP